MENGHVDGLVFGNDFFANTGFAASDALLVDKQPLRAQL